MFNSFFVSFVLAASAEIVERRVKCRVIVLNLSLLRVGMLIDRLASSCSQICLLAT